MARIGYNSSSVGGDLVARAVNYLSQAQYLLTRAKSMADAASGGGATPANLETGGTNGADFGVASGKGASFYTAIADMKTNAATVSAAAIADLDMGGQ